MPAELILTGGTVIPMTGPADRAQAIAIERERILAVGGVDELAPTIGSGTRVVELAGRVVGPGLIDDHVHLTQTGLGSLGPDLSDLTRVDEVLEVLATLVRDWRHPYPLVGQRCAFDRLDRPLLGADLDRIAPNQPVAVSEKGLHALVANRTCRELLCVDGDSDGVYVGRAHTRARKRLYEYFDDDLRRRAQQCAASEAVAVGLTTVHALEGGEWLPDRDVDVLLEQSQSLPVRIVLYWQTTDVAKVLERGLPRMGGDIWLDGAYGEHTAALSESYADQPSTCGVLYYSDTELRTILQRAHREGLQVAMHAIGDRAISQALEAIQDVLSREPRPDHRHRIEHFSLPRPEHVELAASLGVALSMQPPFASESYRTGLAELIGPHRMRWRHPYRRLVDEGLLIAGGSDSDCAPLNPWQGMAELIEHPEPERRLSAYEALHLYTVGGSRIAFQENRTGTLEPGKLADLVVLEQDPLTASATELRNMTVAAVLIGGRLVHGAL